MNLEMLVWNYWHFLGLEESPKKKRPFLVLGENPRNGNRKKF